MNSADKLREKGRAVALLSGGMDSCVAAAVAARNNELFAMHASYGQRTREREKRSFREVAKRIGARDTLEVDLGVLAEIGGSSLVDESRPVPEGDLATGGIPSTYVPFRNGVLLALAVAWAESLEAGSVYIGAVAPDAPDGYPDTSSVFFEAFEHAAAIGTRPETKIKIVAPLVDMTKAEVVRKGLDMGAPLDATWSCYRNGDVACGTCLSCMGRIKAFEEAGVEDSVRYESRLTEYRR